MDYKRLATACQHFFPGSLFSKGNPPPMPLGGGEEEIACSLQAEVAYCLDTVSSVMVSMACSLDIPPEMAAFLAALTFCTSLILSPSSS